MCSYNLNIVPCVHISFRYHRNVYRAATRMNYFSILNSINYKYFLFCLIVVLQCTYIVQSALYYNYVILINEID